MDAVGGVRSIRTRVGVGGAAILTAAVSAFPQAQLATTINIPATCPAVCRTPEVIAPPEALYDTATSVFMPSHRVAGALSCSVALAKRLADLGEIASDRHLP